uniref:Uncharacterized protein n=1 Tax=Knipowitschia caucasica TaxID=637954 RepID=A0AAV2KTW2_KNICA
MSVRLTFHRTFLLRADFRGTGTSEYPHRVSTEYPQSILRVSSEYPQSILRVSSQSILTEYPHRVSSQSILTEYPHRVSSQSILTESQEPHRVTSESQEPHRVTSQSNLTE